MGTTAIYKRAISAIKDNKPFASGALDEYLSTFAINLEKFRISEKDGEFDDQLIQNIDTFVPHRNEVISLFIAISQYAPTEHNILKVHRFFESLIPYTDRPRHITKWTECDSDNFRFIIHELFLYSIAIFTKYEIFKEANILLTQRYYVQGRSEYGKDTMVGYYALRRHPRSLDHRNKRLGLRRLSLHADLLENRSKNSGIDFRYLMQADFILFMRSEIQHDEFLTHWFPVTLLYAGRSHGAFEVFARSSSKSYFDKAKCLLGIDSPSDLNELMTTYKTDQRSLPRWGFESFDPSALIGFEQLATKA